MLAEYLRVHPHRFRLLPPRHSLCKNTYSAGFLPLTGHTQHFFPLLCHSHLLTVVPPLPLLSGFSNISVARTHYNHSTLSTQPSFSSGSLPLICFRCRSIICSLLGEHDGTLAWSALASSLTRSCKQWAERSQLTAAALPRVVSGLDVSKIQNRQTWAQGYIYTMCFIQLFLSKL